MLTPEEIQVATVNPTAAREAYIHADRRLNDMLDTKKVFEQKAFALLGAYITISTALFGAAGFALKSESVLLAVALLLCAILLSIGASFLALAAIDRPYGSPGSEPRIWIRAGTIDAQQDPVPRMLAHVTREHQDSIEISLKSNNVKAGRIRTAIYFGVWAPFGSAVFVAVVSLLSAF